MDTGDGFPLAAAVGSFPPNGFGLHDMVGNIEEWCRDRAGYYFRPVKPATGERIVVTTLTDHHRTGRGGCYESGPAQARSAARDRIGPRQCGNRIGVRPARPVR